MSSNPELTTKLTKKVNTATRFGVRIIGNFMPRGYILPLICYNTLDQDFLRESLQKKVVITIKLYVGNLPYSITSEQLKEIFSEAGEVVDAVVIVDKYSQRSKGFGFVEFSSEEVAQKAIEMFNEKEIEGRPLVVNVARPREEN